MAGGPKRLRRYIAYMVEVRLRAVRVDLQSNTPVLLLQETDGEGRTLPIFIGTPEAAAIAYALQGVTMPAAHDPRPHARRAVVARRRDRAGRDHRAPERHLLRRAAAAAGLDVTVVSSRPSDAVAVAVRTGSPLYVSDELMDSEGIILAAESAEEDEGLDEPPADVLIEQFRQFLKSIKPEDFADLAFTRR